ncbi:MAG: hypothetical protein HYR94_12740, partial [Chloroflexi bacterium]|nr:hypothetical protein [Chloroflexota bacterium]
MMKRILSLPCSFAQSLTIAYNKALSQPGKHLIYLRRLAFVLLLALI